MLFLLLWLCSIVRSWVLRYLQHWTFCSELLWVVEVFCVSICFSVVEILSNEKPSKTQRSRRTQILFDSDPRWAHPQDSGPWAVKLQDFYRAVQGIRFVLVANRWDYTGG
jgi:hypothetical protein